MGKEHVICCDSRRFKGLIQGWVYKVDGYAYRQGQLYYKLSVADKHVGRYPAGLFRPVDIKTDELN